MQEGYNPRPESGDDDAETSSEKSQQPKATPERASELGSALFGGDHGVFFQRPVNDRFKDASAADQEPDATVEADFEDATTQASLEALTDEQLNLAQQQEQAATNPADYAAAEGSVDYYQRLRDLEGQQSTPPTEQSVQAMADEAAAEAIAQPFTEMQPRPDQGDIGEQAPSTPPELLPYQPEIDHQPELTDQNDPMAAARAAAAAAHQQAPQPAHNGYETASFDGAVSPAQPIEQAPSQPSQPERPRGLTSALALVYWFGKRRGAKRERNQAETRFEPIKRGYEKTIDRLKSIITNDENKVRQARVQQVEQTQATSVPVPRPEQQFTTAEVPTLPIPNAERPAQQVVEQTVPAAEKFATSSPRTEQLPKEELLRISDQIVVEGVSVKQMFETGRLDENSLRVIVVEYLRGTPNLQKVVSQEVEKHDKAQFKRFETLNRVNASAPLGGAAAGGIFANNNAQAQQGQLPRPITPAEQSEMLSPQIANNGQSQVPIQKVTTAEKAVMVTSIVFIITALIIIGLLLTRN